MNRFILSEDEKERILNLHESATKRHYLSEQIVTNYDKTYDYKKEGEEYFYKLKNANDWTKASGKGLDAIKTQIYNKPSVSSPKPSVPSSNPIPFKTKEEGDKFREWMNKFYPNTSKNLKLDKSGEFDNSYIRRAWNHTGTDGIKGDIYTKKVLSKGDDKSFSFGGGDKSFSFGGGDKTGIVDTLKKVYNDILNGLTSWSFKPTKGNFVIPFAFPEYEPTVDGGGDEWLAPITKFIFGSSGEKSNTYGKLGHAGIAVVLPDGNVSIHEFGRYAGHKKGYGISKSKSLGKIGKMDKDGLLTNFKDVSENIKRNSAGDGPKLTMNAKLVPVSNSSAANSIARKTTSKPYEGFDMSSTDNDANCGTYTVEIAKAAGVPLGDFCYPNPGLILKSFYIYQVESVTV